ncbi:MAG TPA: MBL fold metallo-hydrolase [Gemmatimonadaceae bacterium]|nr:MBL fold metallo-hydrolase [Gemmatimonadaceae bacterium]
MRVSALGSGSRGNAIVVELGRTRVAVDAGYGIRNLAKRFRAAEISPQSVNACVITHEHIDHIHGALRVREKWHWTLASTAPTLTAIGVAPGAARTAPLRHGESMTVGDVRITLIAVMHDAVSPSAVLLEDTATGARIGVAHDLGVIPDSLARAFERLDLLVIEANHDVGMLRAGPYPPALQERIASARGHLSNTQAATFVRRVAHRGLKGIVLAHLSEQNNTPAIARATVARALAGTAFKGKLIAAPQDGICSVGTKPDQQLRLL